ncbi:MAG: cytochrome b/b6 domain-containing protein [Magnetococcales bacterium]|nr:cytochrome b/b6 domain-containing protein [Magnetococcales bacterium]
MYYDRLTRLLHLLIALGIVGQLMNALVMIHPKPGRMGDGFYAAHEAPGQVLLGLLMLHWRWRMARPGPVAFVRLFPWFSPLACRELFADGQRYLACMRRFSLPHDPVSAPLASAVQGVGLLMATLLGISGTLIFWTMAPGVKMTGWLHAVKELHEGLGIGMWCYLLLHAGMGMAHQMAGHATLSRMFRFREQESEQG